MSNFKGNLDFGIKNIRKRPYRSFCLMLAALIGSYALFVGSVLKGSLNNGMTRMQERMGADLMIVPESSEVKARNILLTGEPEFFYMDISVAQALLDIEGVECARDRAFGVQYHPESAPGPQDSAYLFDKFLDSIRR